MKKIKFNIKFNNNKRIKRRDKTKNIKFIDFM